MPRFVILEHDHPFLHWDFMLEDGAILKTWRLPAPPEPGMVLQATPLGDHRRDRGTFEWLERSDDKLTMLLAGQRLSGRTILQLSTDLLWECRFPV
jgi:hypothetical protein